MNDVQELHHAVIAQDILHILSHIKPDIVGVMASTDAGVVGSDMDIPWNYPLEMRYFSQITQGARVVMGRKTFVTLPNEFFHTRNAIVLSNNHAFSQFTYSDKCSESRIIFCNNLLGCLELIDKQKNLRIHQWQPVFMIGGANVANAFLTNSLLSVFLLTKIRKNYEGDVVLNIGDLKDWHVIKHYEFIEYTILILLNPLSFPNGIRSVLTTIKSTSSNNH